MAYLDSVFAVAKMVTTLTNNTGTVKATLSKRIYVYTYVYMCRTLTVNWELLSVAGTY